jgi:hypothetical protein
VPSHEQMPVGLKRSRSHSGTAGLPLGNKPLR